MFAYLQGSLTYKSPSLLHIDVNGAGYEVNITLQTFSKVQHEERYKLFTHVHVREDAWIIYGFADETERDTFRKLIAINGVGAGTARIILSSMTPAELEQAVFHEDAKALEKVKGIGGKTAQRIILELKGKLISTKNIEGTTAVQHNTIREDALIALVNLGISRAVAEAAVKKIENSSALSVEELIKQALRAL